MNNALTLSLEQCQELLQDIREKRRHRLTGSEYKAIIQAVDNHRVDREVMQLARQVAAQLAQHEGPGSKPPFEDPTMNRVFMVESQPVTPAENDPRMQEHVVVGKTVFRSREYDHVARANVPNDRGDPGREVTAKRLDIQHEGDGVVDRYNVYQVMTNTHTTYGSGVPSTSKDGDKTLRGTYGSFQAACDAIDTQLGMTPRSRLANEQMQRLQETRARRSSAPRPA